MSTINSPGNFLHQGFTPSLFISVSPSLVVVQDGLDYKFLDGNKIQYIKDDLELKVDNVKLSIELTSPEDEIKIKGLYLKIFTPHEVFRNDGHWLHFHTARTCIQRGTCTQTCTGKGIPRPAEAANASENADS